MTRLALEGCLRAEQGPSLVTVRRLFRTLGFLLGYNANVDDKHRSQMQDVVRSAAFLRSKLVIFLKKTNCLYKTLVL